MAKKFVVWTETAIKQRREILKYWTKRNGSTVFAEKLIRLIAKQINLLKNIRNLLERLIFLIRENQPSAFSVYTIE